MGLREEDVGNLESNAANRKRKLEALKQRKKPKSGADEQGVEEELPKTQVLFRNYKPDGENFSGEILPPVPPDNIEEMIQDQLKHEKSEQSVDDVEVKSLAPKKPTFDLQRAIQPQLDKLERKTDKAIALLIRERLKEGRKQDFLSALNAGVKSHQEEAAAMDSDDD